MEQDYQIGVVLSGGGVKGMAHLGAMKALNEHGIKPEIFSGSSVGAIVGAFLAANYSPSDILEFFKSNKTIFRWQHFSMRKPGLLDAEKYQEMFDPWLEGTTFESLERPLFICATDVLNGHYQVFSTGDLVRPLLASAAVPGFFTPVEIEGEWFVDGGVMNNFPVEPLVNRCSAIIGSYVSPVRRLQKSEITHSIKLWQRATDLSFAAASVHKFPDCHYVLYPQELWKYNIFDTGKLDEIFQVGYQFAIDHMDSIRKALPSVKPGQGLMQTKTAPIQKGKD